MLSVSGGRRCDSIVVAQSMLSCGAVPALTSTAVDSLADVAGKLAASARETRDAALLHALAVVDAVSEQGSVRALDRALALLDEVAAAPDPPVAVQVDRAALRLQRYGLRQSVVDLLAGLDAASIAAAQAPADPAACWNRAVALTWLGMREALRSAWQTCEGIRGHSAMPPRVVDRGSSETDDKASIALSGRWPEVTREYAWATVLPLWGRSVRMHRADSAEHALRLLDSAARLTLTRARDSTLDRVRGDIARAGSDAVIRLGRAAELFADGRSEGAGLTTQRKQQALDSAVRLTEPSHELYRWSRLSRAHALLLSGASSAARDSFAGLHRESTGRDDAFRVRTQWGQALALMAMGRHAQSLPIMQEVRTRSAALGMQRTRLAEAAFASEVADLLGDVAGAEDAGQMIVSAIGAVPVGGYHWSGMRSLRSIAVANRLPVAAAELDRENLAVARLLGKPDLAMDAVYYRSNEAIERGDMASAQRDLREARALWLPKLSASDRAWNEPDILRLEGEVARGSDPARSRLLLDSAVRLLGDEQNDLRRTTIALSRARSAAATGDTTQALRDLDGLLTMLNQRGGSAISVFDRAELDQVSGSVSQFAGLLLGRRGAAVEALRALSGAPFGSASSDAACCDAAPRSARFALRQVNDEVWVWSGPPRAPVLRTVRIPGRIIAAAGALDVSALGVLYDSLVPQLVQSGDGRRPEMLVLDVRGALAAVPWGALRDREHGRYLIEEVAITLTDGLPRAQIVSRSLPARVALVAAAPRTADRALPGAAREIDSLVSVWKAQAVPVDGQRGGAHVLQRSFDASIIHFAGHAILDRVRPERSYLSVPSRGDSSITAAQILGRRFNAVRLVVLAGCETRGFGSGVLSGFDSLAGAFLAAGAGAVIGAGWPVDDASTATLMHRLHTELQAGAEPSQALRAAQIAAIRSTDATLRSPRVWAAFQLMGS